MYHSIMIRTNSIWSISDWFKSSATDRWSFGNRHEKLTPPAIRNDEKERKKKNPHIHNQSELRTNCTWFCERLKRKCWWNMIRQNTYEIWFVEFSILNSMKVQAWAGVTFNDRRRWFITFFHLTVLKLFYGPILIGSDHCYFNSL